MCFLINFNAFFKISELCPKVVVEDVVSETIEKISLEIAEAFKKTAQKIIQDAEEKQEKFINSKTELVQAANDAIDIAFKGN